MRRLSISQTTHVFAVSQNLTSRSVRGVERAQAFPRKLDNRRSHINLALAVGTIFLIGEATEPNSPICCTKWGSVCSKLFLLIG